MTTEYEDKINDPPEDVAGSVPGAAKAAAFRAQLTPKFQRDALRFARRRAHVIRDAGRTFDRYYPREVVADVLGEIWSGVIPWDPTDMPLIDRVRYSIGKRMWRDATRSRNHRAVSLDEGPGDALDAITAESGKSLSVECEVTEAHASSGDLSPLMLRAAAMAVGRALEKLVRNSETQRAVARAWAEGHVGQAEAMVRSELSLEEYKAARRALLLLAPSLPRDLRDAATDLLRRAS